MRYFFAKMDYNSFISCIQQGRFGQNRNIMHNIKAGDRFFVLTNHGIVGLFEATTNYYFDDTKIWNDGVYPYRVNINLIKLVRKEDAIDVDLVKEELRKTYGNRWVFSVILNLKPLSEDIVKLIVSKLSDVPSVSTKEINVLAVEEQKHVFPSQKETKSEPIEDIVKDSSEHTVMQYYLIKIGNILGFTVCIDYHDKNKECKGEKFSDITEKFPEIPFYDPLTLKIMKSIDVIWFDGPTPMAAFEVENTTNITNGLLKLSDLLTLAKTMTIISLIIAPDDKYNMFKSKINRPTFKVNKMPEKIFYLPYTKLKGIYENFMEYGKNIDINVFATNSIDANIDGFIVE